MYPDNASKISRIPLQNLLFYGDQVDTTTEWLNMNSPGWSEAEPGVRNDTQKAVRDSILKIADIIVSDGRMNHCRPV